MAEKIYTQFDVGAQANAQRYNGGFWTGNNLDLTSELGIVKPGPAASDQTYTSYNANLVVDTFAANGTWTCPANVTSATVECWGAGGGGTTNTGGGGGGAYSKKVVTVVPTTGYAIAVGTSAANTAGGDSTFATTTVVAKGGASGATGTGGAASGGTGDTKYSGGNGSTGTGNRGGGGGAGDGADGSNGSSSVGGDGGSTNGGPGGFAAVGYAMGGGGGSAAAAQSAGGRGAVRVTYSVNQTDGYPSVRARSWNKLIVAGTSHAITMPSSIGSGDLLILVFGCSGTPTITTPTGWTLLDTSTNGHTQSIFYRRATGSDSATVTTSTSQTSSHVVYRIANAATPTATVTTGTSTNPNPPSSTNGSGTGNRLWIATDTQLVTSLNVSAAPSGYASLINEPGFATSGTAINVAEFTGTSDTENPGTFTNANSAAWIAGTIGMGFTTDLSGNSDTIVDMELYSVNNSYDIYALVNQGTVGCIVARSTSTDAFGSVHAITENPVGSLVRFNAWLLWCTTSGIGKYDGTTFTDAYKTWATTQDTGLYVPSVTFVGKQFFGNMRYIASLDTSGTWTNNALTLPADVKVIDMRIWNDQIAILAQQTGASIGTKVYFWDGVSATYNEVIGVNEAQPTAIYSYLGSLLMFGLNGRIYEYRGISADGLSDFQIISDVPGEPIIKSPACVVMADGMLLFGVLGVSSNAIGVWAYGRLPVSNTVALFQRYTPKGDYKYDDGVSDYFSVTTLFNFRTDDSAFSPLQTGTPATLTNDTSSGSTPWAKITSKTAGSSPADTLGLATSTTGSVVAHVKADSNAYIQVSTTSGTSWNDRDSQRDWRGICMSDDGVNMAATVFGGNIYVSTNTGATWTSKASVRNWLKIRCDADMSVIAGMYSSTSIDISSDTGANWTTRAVGGGTVVDVCMNSTGATMYAATGGTTTVNIRKSTDTGASWSSVGINGVSIQSIACSSDGSIILAGTSANGLYLSTNSGASFTQISTIDTTGNFAMGVAVSSDGTKMIAARAALGAETQDMVFYSDNTGANWSWLGNVTQGASYGWTVTMSDDGTLAYAGDGNPDTGTPIWLIAPITSATLTDDDVFVYTGSTGTSTSSFYLKALNPGMSVDTSKSIAGIQVVISMKKATGTTATDLTVKLVQGGTIVGDNKGANTDRSATEGTYTYGSPTDLWGTTWTPAQVNAATFGVVVQASNTAAVLAIDTISVNVYWPIDPGIQTQEEFLYAAVRRGNTTAISETATVAIVDLKAAGFSTANMVTAGEDFELPSNNKLLRSMSIETAKPLVAGETITLYAIEDSNTTAQALKDISWTQIASWTVGEDNLEKWLDTPFTARRFRFRFEITPQPGSPTTPPTLIGYRANFTPLKLYKNG